MAALRDSPECSSTACMRHFFAAPPLAVNSDLYIGIGAIVIL